MALSLTTFGALLHMSGSKFSERLLLLILAAVQFTHIMDFMVMMPLGPQLMRIFNLTPDQFSLLVASYTFSAGVSGFIGAMCLDRFGRKNALLFCYAGFLLGTLACALAPNYHALLVARILSGAFGGVSGSLVMTVVGDVVPLTRRAGAMGIIMTAFSVASVVGVPVGLWLAAHWSWHAPFIIIVISGLGIWGMAARLMPPLREHLKAAAEATTKPEAEAPVGGLKELLTTRNTLLALFFGTLMVFGHFILIPFLSPSLVANAGMAESELAYIYLVGGLASLFTAPWIGRLADRHGRPLLFAIMIFGALAPMYWVTRLGPTSLWIILLVAAAFFTFAGGRFVPGQAIITSAVPMRLRGSFMSLNSCTRDLAAGLASLLGGHIIEREASTGRLLHYPTLGWIAIIVSLISLIAVRWVRAVE